MNNKWIVSLSDGQQISEDTLQNSLKEKGSSLSPWNYLLGYLKDNPSKEITHIKLIVNGKTYNSPSKSKNARFENDIYPDDFWVCRKLSIIGITGPSTQKDYISFSYRLGEYRHYLWIDVQTNETYIEIINSTNDQYKVVESEYTEIKRSRIAS